MAPDDEDESPAASASWLGQWVERDAGALRGFAAGSPLWPVLAACAVLAAGWQWHWRDKLDLLDSRQAEHAALRESAGRQAAEAASAEPLRRRLAELTQALTRRERHLPDHGGIDDLLVTLSALATARGLRIVLFQPQAAEAGEEFARIPLRLRVDGGYREIAAWLADIAALPRLVTLQSMQLAAGKEGRESRERKDGRDGRDAGELTMEAVALAYRALDVGERAAQQRGARTSRGKAGSQPPPSMAWTPAPLDVALRLPLLGAHHAGDTDPAAIDPFAYARLAAPSFAPPDDALAARPREPLEAYALEQIRMVGSLHSAGRAYGVIRVDGADGMVAALQVGQRLGRRDGVVVRIGRDEIVLRERVWNGEDRWIETTARLALDAPA
ncbi:pilus assembly protein PilP [Cupriavidus sp. DB3]|uniref:pilus assembly protein PilP n=1 Tax=Cupriavidus sp. DB3 TaxID=2873259 RepID=UPI001CF1F927|nr:pilus assembly protein PilP [Cupriavidus sp. DB3]MCA7086656.1 pilus assembly protein PilP [Cupriavidus sp. DB3]